MSLERASKHKVPIHKDRQSCKRLGKWPTTLDYGHITIGREAVGDLRKFTLRGLRLKSGAMSAGKRGEIGIGSLLAREGCRRRHVACMGQLGLRAAALTYPAA